MEEKSLFLRCFGDSPKMRVVDFLVVSAGMDYSMKEIAVKSGAGYSTLKLFWDDLLSHRIIVPTRVIGNAKLFRLNKENPAVLKFVRMYWEVTKELTAQMHKPMKVAPMSH